MSTHRLAAWQTIAAIAAGICLVSTVLFALIGNPFADAAGEPVDTPGVTLTATPPTASPEEDLTGAFRAFVLLDAERTPPGLDSVTQVHWTDSGQLWAETSLAPGTNASSTEVRVLCGLLSRFVTSTRSEGWAPVSVRAADGSELLTRREREGDCNP